jgi:hypothetical protein
MLSNKFLANNLLHLSLLAVSSVFLLSACEQKADVNKALSLAKSEVTQPAEATNMALKADCLPSTGSAMEDGQVTVCHYNTDSLALVYAAIVQDRASEDDFGYALLRKTLPAKDLDDKFDSKETWIKYAWADKAHLKVSIQMAGGEDTLEFAKENGKVKVVTTLSAD